MSKSESDNLPANAGDVMPAANTAREVTTDSEVFQRFLAAADDATADLDPDQIAMEIVATILGAETADDVLGGREATHAADFLKTPFVLVSVKFNRSTFENAGPSFYAVLEGATDEGEKVVVTCGAKNVIAQAWKLADLDALPIRLQIEQSPRPTASGNYVMWLAKAPAAY